MKGSKSLICQATIGLALACAAPSASAQSSIKLIRERDAQQRPTLLVLGVSHFDNPGRDVVNIIVDDVMSAARQKEIARVTAALAAFHPDFVAVEWPRNKQDKLDARYKDFREDRYALTRDERDQLGLRVAAERNLAHVNAVDWNDEPPGDEKLYAWDEYAQSHGEKELMAAITDPQRTLGIVPQANLSIGAWLVKMNSAESLAASQRNYFDIAAIGDEHEQPGANWVGYWYGRNLRIFNNLIQLTDRPADRILVIYGAGHAYLLRQFARESGAFRLVDVDAVLKIPK
jgi:hypothetical protein